MAGKIMPPPRATSAVDGLRGNDLRCVPNSFRCGLFTGEARFVV
jgi:hypothetical protein